MYIEDDYEVSSNQQTFLEEINFHARHLLGYACVKWADASEMDNTAIYMESNFREHSLKLNREVCLPMGSYELGRLAMDSIYCLHFRKWMQYDLMH